MTAAGSDRGQPCVLSYILPSVLTGKIIDEGLIGRDFEAPVKYVLLSLGVTFGASLVGVAETYGNTWLARQITYDMRNQMYAHLQQKGRKKEGSCLGGPEKSDQGP